jgi:drug/metabolite transporter (DMT)-like permease
MTGMSQRLGILTLIGITVIWGTTFVIVKDLLTALSVPLLLTLRFSVAGLLLAGARPKATSLRAGLILSVLVLVGYATQTIGLQFTSASNSAFITGFSVILTPVIGAWFFRKRLGPRVYLACLIALIGLALMTLSDLERINIGDIWTFVTAISYALYILYLGQVAHRHSALGLSALQIWLVALVGWLWLIPTIGELRSVTPAMLAQIIYLAAFPTVLTSFLQAKAQRVVPAHLAALIFVLEPVFAAVFAYLLLGERLGAAELTGAALVLVAMTMSQWRMSKSRRARRDLQQRD